MAGCRLTALLVCFFVLTGGSQGFTVEPAQSDLYVRIGEDAEFTARPSSAISGGNWVFKGKTVVSWIGTGQLLHPEYNSRVNLSFTSGSLVLRSVNESDNGDYRLTVNAKSGGTQVSVTFTLQALEPVSTPNITSNVSSFIEHNDTAVLACVAAGTDVSYTWLEDNNVIPNGGRLELSASNTTLTITGVLRSDGPFSCRASNPISAETSEPFHLNVFYGPDLPNIIPDPDTPAYTSGTDVTLTCSAESKPAAVLSWFRQGDLVQSGAQLTFPNVSNEDIGSYVCQAFNNITRRYNSSSILIVVQERVENVSLQSNISELVEHRDSVLLTCSSQGTQLKREWLFNNQSIQQNDRINISGDMLIIDPVNRTDAGMYRCIVSNGLNNGSAETSLLVFYGPDNMKITPQSPVKITNGNDLKLTCSAQSLPIPEYEWFNGANWLVKGPEFTISPVSEEHSGKYTCHVNNSKTERNNNLTAEVIVVIVQPSGLGAGAIAGIVIGVFVVGGGIGGGTTYLHRKKMSRLKSGTPSSDHKMSPRGNIPVTQTEYAAIGRKQPNPQQLEPSNNGTSTAPAQTSDGHVIYSSPQIVAPGVKPSGEIVSEDKTTYAELKYR